MTIEPITLYHYTTPTRAARILEDGLEPRSRLPHTNEPVSFAFTHDLPYAWSNSGRDFRPGMDFLTMLLVDARKEGDEGIVELTFRTNEGRVFDRNLGNDPEAYHESGVSLTHYALNRSFLGMILPEAAVGPIKDIEVSKQMSADETKKEIKTYLFY